MVWIRRGMWAKRDGVAVGRGRHWQEAKRFGSPDSSEIDSVRVLGYA